MSGASRSLAFRVLTPIVAFGFVLFVTVIGFVYLAVSEFVDRQASNDLRWRSFGVRSIMDSNLDELQRAGKADDEFAVRSRKVNALMAIEDFARVNELKVEIRDLQDGREVEFGSDFAMAPESGGVMARLLSDEIRYYNHEFSFEPWRWEVTLSQDNRAYLGLFGGLLRGAGISVLVFVIGTTGFMFYLTDLTNKPIRRIIRELERNQPPQYQGIAEFEYLSHSISKMMGAIREQSQLLEATFANIGEGLCVFDSDMRCLACNAKFREIYALGDATPADPALTAVLSEALGVSPSEFARAAVAHQRVLEHVRPSGRVIEVRVNPMGDGHYVSTHEDVTERKIADSRIRHLATHDVLTEQPNRFLFQDRLHQAIASARRTGRKGGVLFIDLDRFKDVNDTLGHEVGDQLLKEIATRIDAAVRESDTAARFGGDEFAVLIPLIDDSDELVTISEKLIELLAAPFQCRGSAIQAGASIGITVFPDDGGDVIRLLRNADIALYEAKAAGRGQYRFFTEKLNARVQERATLTRDLRRALDHDEFVLRYQPQIDLRTRRIVGVEALLRWQHPSRGTLQPTAFIALAEQTGQIVPIGEWVLRQACAQAQEWARTGVNLRVAVNVSAVQLRRSDIVQLVERALHDYTLAPGQLELEITESMLLDDPENTVAILQRLRELGVRISLDDFGTGYSSLSYLRRLPLTNIKIDRSFIRDVHARVADATIVRGIIELAHGLGAIRVIAEGVETWAQFETLRDMHCDEGQGFLLCGPVTAGQVLALPSQRKIANGATSFRFDN